MLEDIIFGSITLPGEIFRVLIALIGTGVATYYDIYNNKNIPDNMLYAFLGIAFLVNIIFYEETLFWFSIGLAVFFSAIGYLFYRVGQLGGADVYVLASVMLLLPIHPSFVNMSFNIPFIFSVIVFSGVLFALYVLLFFGRKLYDTKAKPNWVFALMAIPYLLFAYIYVNSFLFSPIYFVFITILLASTIFFLMFKKSLNAALSESMPISQVEPEDVLALEIMNKDFIERYKIPRVATKAEIERLIKAKIQEVYVYTKLPPFIPFLMAGMILSLLFASSLLLL